MYTVHFYAATHKQWLRDKTDAAIAQGLHIFISESAGMEATGDGPINEEEWLKWIIWMEAKKLSWVSWSVSDKNETCSYESIRIIHRELEEKVWKNRASKQEHIWKEEKN